MKVAVIGSRNLQVHNLEAYLPSDTTELVSGGAKGIDNCVREYAQSHHIPLKEFLPEYAHYGRYAAPVLRNQQIVEYADMVLAFWDGASRGTAYTIRYCKEKEVPVTVITLPSHP